MKPLFNVLLFVSIALGIIACNTSAVNQNDQESQDKANAAKQKLMEIEAKTDRDIKNLQDLSKSKTTLLVLHSIKSACQIYRLSYKKNPESIHDLLHTPDGRSLLDDKKDLKDEWNRPILFEKKDKQIKVFSVGEDGKANTEDDVVSVFQL